MKHYRAPWGSSLIVMSALGTAVCVGVTAFRWRFIVQAHLGQWSFWLGVSPLVLLIGAVLFAIRGYSLAPDTLIVHRLLWSTRLPLNDLRSAEFRPGAMQGSIRTFGNGGFFSFAGRYYSRVLGSYRCFVTDFKRTAVLRFSSRTVVLSPDRPEDFVQELSSSLHGA